MNFNFQRHIRLAGTVAIFAGLFLHNWNVVLLGWTVVAAGYMAAISKIERYIEEQEPKSKEEAEDAVR